MPSLQVRLQQAMWAANLTVADLARWFDRPHATVRCWVHGTNGVGGPPGDAAAIELHLKRLEALLAKKKGPFPVPRLSSRARIDYLRRINAQ